MDKNINKATRGHLAAGFTILIWSTTYISTKVLLEDFTPTEILFFRFIVAYIMLFFLSPHPLIPKLTLEELKYAAAGLCGVTIYFLFQNIGLTYTLASNAGLLVSIAPMFTAVIAYYMGDKAVFHKRFILGFVLSITGVFFISFNGRFILQLNPMGDILMLMAALSWAFYSNILTRLENMRYTLVQRTRKVFFYGLLFMIPALFIMDFNVDPLRFYKPVNLANILFLGLGASAICFLIWNYAVSCIGSVKATAYIYFSPIITILFSYLLLREQITWASVLGTILILTGLMISERKKSRNNLPDNDCCNKE